MTKDWNTFLGEIISFENGELGNEEVFSLFQKLIDSGLIWELQPNYIRVAFSLAREGYVNFDN